MRSASAVLPSSLLVLAVLSGCSALRDLGFEDPGPPPLASAPEDSSKVPFTLEVVSERLDPPETLRVDGALVVSMSLDTPPPAALHLGVMKDGVSTSEKTLSLRDILGAAPGRRLVAGERIPFSIAVPARGATDYQLELLWGEDAESVLASGAEPVSESRMAAAAAESPGPDPMGQGSVRQSAAPPLDRSAPTDPLAASSQVLQIPRIELVEMQVERVPAGCTEAGCRFSFRITGRLQNRGTVGVSGVTLGVGFRLIGQQRDTPDGEDRVDVAGIQLAPGMSKRFRLNVEREVSLDQASTIAPFVRILEVH